MASSDPSHARVLIVGGGVAGLEAALALQDLVGDRVEVEMHSPREHFLYRPFAVGEPYGMAHSLHYDLERLTDRCGVALRLGSIASVDAGARQATTHDGERIDYDYLIVASGARMLWAVPGAVTFWGVADEGAVQEVVRQLRDGDLRSVAFTMPGGRSWGLPVYELALLADAELAKAGIEGVRLVVVTPEGSPLQLFGRQASVEVSSLLAERGIEVVSGAHPVKFEGGRLFVAPGDEIEVEAVVSMPRLEGQRIAGVSHDGEGFVAVDEHGWVRGMDRVLAAGDVTAFPVKQGGVATQQADAAAEALAAAIGGQIEPEPFDPILRGVLWTGGEPRYLYGRLAGGHGETSTLSDRAPWPAEHHGKIIGRYLSPFLAEL
jgi:sulfide:quinone oxidoreductase